MSTYSLQVQWKRREQVFLDQQYSRKHIWRFDGGITLQASSSPHVVPLPLSDVSAVDPEEAFVASVSSCHMLWFLSISARQGYLIDSYKDDPVGTMKKNRDGKMAMTKIELRPSIDFSGGHLPDDKKIGEIHVEAHDNCFIANSIKSKVRVAGFI